MGFFNYMANQFKRVMSSIQSGNASRAISAVCKRAALTIKRVVFQTKKFFRTLEWEQLPRNFLGHVKHLLQAVWNWIKAHPYLSSFLVICVIVAIMPAVVYVLILGAVGFAAAGPVAGSVAAGVQAAAGLVPAGGAFAVLQSAAMGGYGVAIVAAGIQAAACVAAAVAFAWSYINRG